MILVEEMLEFTISIVIRLDNLFHYLGLEIARFGEDTAGRWQRLCYRSGLGANYLEDVEGGGRRAEEGQFFSIPDGLLKKEEGQFWQIHRTQYEFKYSVSNYNLNYH